MNLIHILLRFIVIYKFCCADFISEDINNIKEFTPADHCEEKCVNYGKYEDFPEYPEACESTTYKTVLLCNNEKIFSSACVQCLLCQTIAREFHHKLMSSFYSAAQFPFTVIYNSAGLNNTLKSFCDSSFKNFDLREYMGSHYVDRISRNSKHVNCGVEGLWPIKLKEMCNNFMQHREFELYERWIKENLSPDFDVIDLFCRSYGIFQYCRNLDITSNIKRNMPKFYTYFNKWNG